MYILNGKALEILNKYYGYSSFRRGQEEIIDEILNGSDVLVLCQLEVVSLFVIKFQL